MRKTAEFLIEGLKKVRIVGTRVRYSVPSIIQQEESKDLSNFFRATIILDFGCGRGKKFFPLILEDRELDKKILYQLNPRWKRSVLRPALVRATMNGLIKQMRDAGRKAIKEAPKAGLKAKAERLIQERRARRRDEEYHRGVETIRSVLLGSARDMELEDLIRLWNECHVEVVMDI